MAIRNIIKEGDVVLREKCREVTLFDERLAIMLDDMKETMVAADGVGIAAPQIGVLRRVCIIQVGDGRLYELINPVVLKASGEQVGVEGCLSVPGRQGNVKRPEKLTVSAYDRTGKKVKHIVSGYEAVAFSHEMDHLDGVLFIDKLETGDNKKKNKNGKEQ